MDKIIYEKISSILEKNRVEEEPEDILLELAEMLGDKEILDQPVTAKASYGKLVAEAEGSCREDGETGEILVYVKTLKLGKEIFSIEEFLL